MVLGGSSVLTAGYGGRMPLPRVLLLACALLLAGTPLAAAGSTLDRRLPGAWAPAGPEEVRAFPDRLEAPDAEGWAAIEDLADGHAALRMAAAVEEARLASVPAPSHGPSGTGPGPASPPVPAGSVWDRLAACESGGRWDAATGNGFWGGLQFTLSSWAAVGGTGLPSAASREEQISRAVRLQAIQGWGAWPACSRKLGLR